NNRTEREDDVRRSKSGPAARRRRRRLSIGWSAARTSPCTWHWPSTSEFGARVRWGRTKSYRDLGKSDRVVLRRNCSRRGGATAYALGGAVRGYGQRVRRDKLAKRTLIVVGITSDFGGSK
ncbi:hypothetical protein Dimus_030326, partial [Dionaea muscipula]